MSRDTNFSNNANQGNNQTEGIQNYIGMPYNGDCNIYKQGVIKALLKLNDDSIMTAVLEAKSDYQIAKILIKNHLYDTLIDEFHCIDVFTCVQKYIDELTHEVLADFERKIQKIKDDNKDFILEAKLHQKRDPYVDELIRKLSDLTACKLLDINHILADKINLDIMLTYKSKVKNIDERIYELQLKKAELEFFKNDFEFDISNNFADNIEETLKSFLDDIY